MKFCSFVVLVVFFLIVVLVVVEVVLVDFGCVFVLVLGESSIGGEFILLVILGVVVFGVGIFLFVDNDDDLLLLVG